MRLLLPMAYTFAFVMKGATCADDKPSNTNDNYTYRLLELDVEPPPPESQMHTTRQPYNERPSNEDYDDNSHQQSIIPRRTHSYYPKHNGGGGGADNDSDDDEDNDGEVVKPTVTKANYKKAARNGKKIVNVEIPDDFQREISQLRIPRRVTKKKKKSKSSVKKPQRDVNMGTDMDLDMDIDMDVDMDVNVGEEENARGGGDEDDNDNSSNSNNDDNNSNNNDDDNDSDKKYKKGGKRYKSGKGKGKGKNKSSGNGNAKSRGTGKERGSGSGKNNNNNNNEGDDDDESNHQEEEEEVEEKKEKVHKVTIKKRRPYVNGTKPTATSASASASGAKPGTPILHTHSHSYSRHPYQHLITGKKPVSAKLNLQTTGSSGTGAKRLPKQKHQQKQPPPSAQHQPQTVKLVKPLTLQENAAVEVLNANHQENAVGGVRKGIKPRDVNLILRTKNSPRILIRRYKPLFGAYPVGLNLVGRGGQRKILYRRPYNTRKKACKKCKKKRNKHKFFTHKFPASASGDVEMVHSTADLANLNAAAGPTSCAHTDPLSPLSPLQVSPFSGPTYPWYGDGDGTSAIGTPSSYFPNNKFEYADENVISPRLPSQPVNAYIRMPLPMPQSSPSPAAYGSGRSSDGSGDDDDSGANNNGDVVYQSLPFDDNANPAIATAGTRQQQNQIKDDKPRRQQQHQQRSREEKPPAYHVHETEYEPVTGHANVEELAAVHQRETDDSLFAVEEHDRNPQLQPYAADAENIDDHDNVAFAMVEEASEGEEQDEQQEDEQDPVEEGEHEGQEQQDGGRGGDDEEEEKEGEEAEAEGSIVEGVEEDNQEPDGQHQQYVEEENENPKSDNIFDISNVDAWMDDMIETETES